MKVLVIGSGGREHAIAYTLSKSSKVSEIHAIPGNPGISKIGTCHNMKVEDLNGILEFVEKNKSKEKQTYKDFTYKKAYKNKITNSKSNDSFLSTLNSFKVMARTPYISPICKPDTANKWAIPTFLYHSITVLSIKLVSPVKTA